MSALVKRPPVIAPWPPADTSLKPVTVSAQDGLGEVATRNQMTLKELLKVNFQIDMDTQRDWAFFVNWYLQEKLRCTRLTPGGNYKFSGGETLYARPIGLPKPVKPPAPPPYNLGTLAGVRKWFNEEIIGARTVGKGHLGQNVMRGVDMVVGDDDGEPNPNGWCGETVYYIISKFREATNGVSYDDTQAKIDGMVMGQVLWNGFDIDRPSMTPNHTAVIICPNVRLKVFTMDMTNTGVIDKTPAEGNASHTYDMLKNCRVLDLYQMQESSLEEWWRKSSWFGWGRITIDTTPGTQFLER